MNAQQSTPRIRWRRLLVILTIGATIIAFPMWHQLLFPDFWSDTRCVFTDTSGDLHMGQGAGCEASEQ